MKNNLQITEVTINNKSLFDGAKVKQKKSGKIRTIFVLPEGMRISEAVEQKIFNVETQVEYETVMLNKHLFELVNDTSDEDDDVFIGRRGYALDFFDEYEEEFLKYAKAKGMISKEDADTRIKMYDKLVKVLDVISKTAEPDGTGYISITKTTLNLVNELLKQTEGK